MRYKHKQNIKTDWSLGFNFFIIQDQKHYQEIDVISDFIIQKILNLYFINYFNNEIEIKFQNKFYYNFNEFISQSSKNFKIANINKNI